MMKMKVGGASCRVVFRKHLGGSVIKGTVFNRWESVTTHLKVDSSEPADRLAHLIRNAKAGCFAEGLITQQVPLVSHIEVNGKPFQIDGVPDGASQVERPR
jgi:hypothetical protein